VSDRTLSAISETTDRRSQGAPHLFLVLDAARPTEPPLRLRLDGIDSVEIGRGPRGCSLERRHAQLRVDDALVSSRHARLTRVLHRWVIEDLGSKNGTVVDRASLSPRAELEDGSLIEIGQTFFRFRAALPSTGGPPIASPTAPPATPLLATLMPPLERALDDLARVARSSVSVVVDGETGTGKEVMARAIHALSGRSGPFVGVNCGALPANLIETELFGYKKGAFSGAVEDRPGLVRAAHGGTLFLDEIGDLPRPAQAAFLRVLQEREVLPVGGTRPTPVDIRLVAATHQPLAALVDAGGFRADLAMRVAGHRLSLPPLRERREDLGLMIAAMWRDRALKLAPKAARALLRYGWPGNVRELEKALGAAAVLATDGVVGLAHLPQEIAAEPVGPTPEGAGTVGAELEALERARMVEALSAEGGNQTRAAARIGMPLRTFQKRVKRYGLT